MKLGDTFKQALAVAALATSVAANPMPANAQGFHMTGSMMMPPEVASSMAKQMCTDKVMMDNSMMSKDACKAMKKGDMELMAKHMHKKAETITPEK